MSSKTDLNVILKHKSDMMQLIISGCASETSAVGMSQAASLRQTMAAFAGLMRFEHAQSQLCMLFQHG